VSPLKIDSILRSREGGHHRTLPAGHRDQQALKSANFVAGTLLMFCGGLIMTGTLALLPTMPQNLMNYPALTTGMVTMPRGIGSMAAMFLVAPLINRVDSRLTHCQINLC
jgi:DHA2 family multidrug resistance protein